jgi:hypothetical protein
MLADWVESATCRQSTNWHANCKNVFGSPPKKNTMPQGPHLAHSQPGQRIKRLWLWLGLSLGTAGGLLAGWLIAG